MPPLTGAVASAVVSFDRESDAPTLACCWGLSPQVEQRLHAHVELAGHGEACRSCRPLTARLEQHCPLLQPMRASPASRELASVVCLPVDVQGRRRAVVSAYLGPQRRPTPDDLQALVVLGAQVGAALHALQLETQGGARAPRAACLSHGRLLRPWLETVLQLVAAAALADAAALQWHGQTRLCHTTGAGLTDDPELPRGLFETASTLAARGPYGELVTVEGPFTGLVLLPLDDSRPPAAWLALGWLVPSAAARVTHIPWMSLAHRLIALLRHVASAQRRQRQAMAEERARLSRELHDGLAQTLAFLKLQAERTARLLRQGELPEAQQELSSWAQTVAQAYEELRQTIDGLRLGARPHPDIRQAILEAARLASERWGVPVEVDAPVSLPRRVPASVQLHLLPILYEALTNACRHSGASRIRVGLHPHPDGLELVVEDDGRGFDPACVSSLTHHGLRTMQERARLLGALLTLTSGPGRGTTVRLWLPRRRRLTHHPSTQPAWSAMAQREGADRPGDGAIPSAPGSTYGRMP